jgi:hypothetical protein
MLFTSFFALAVDSFRDQSHAVIRKGENMICYGIIRGRDWQQEHYESSTRDAGRRVRDLRKAGFTAYSVALGMQVTSVGLVRMTMVDVRGIGDREVPAPEKVERL